jgi:hypothetical protein
LHDRKEIGKQTSNDEGRARDLQIEEEKKTTGQPRASTKVLGNRHRVTVDVQDKATPIERYPGRSLELKWDK